MSAAWRGRGVGVGLCCLIVGVVVVVVRGAEAGKGAGSDKLQKLFEERVKLADEGYQACAVAYEAGTVTLDLVLAAANELAEAKLALAKTKAERIAIRDKQVERAKDYEAKIKALAGVAARGGEPDKVALAGIARVKAEIALELEKGEGNAGEKP